MTSPSPYLTVREAAEYCRLSPKTLLNNRSTLPAMPGSPGKLLFTRAMLDQWLSTRRKTRREPRRATAR